MSIKQKPLLGLPGRVSPQDNLIKTRDEIARKLIPMGYSINVMRDYRGGGLVNISSPYDGCAPRNMEVRGPSESPAIISRAIAWARRDYKIAQLAKKLCRAIGVDPNLFGPYPFGPRNVSGPVMVNGGYGGGQIVSAPTEMRKNVDWLWPHAAIETMMREDR